MTKENPLVNDAMLPMSNAPDMRNDAKYNLARHVPRLPPQPLRCDPPRQTLRRYSKQVFPQPALFDLQTPVTYCAPSSVPMDCHSSPSPRTLVLANGRMLGPVMFYPTTNTCSEPCPSCSLLNTFLFGETDCVQKDGRPSTSSLLFQHSEAYTEQCL